MKKLFFYFIAFCCIILIMSSCQDSFSAQSFVFVIETDNEDDTYEIEYVKLYVNGKERETVQIDTLGKVFYTFTDIAHNRVGQRLEFLPVIIKRIKGNGKIRFSIVEYNRPMTLPYADLPENIKKRNNILSDEDLDWVHENAAYSVILQPTEKEKEILINSII